jgi:hypothetical protein
MSYVYLLDLYKRIDQRLSEVGQSMDNSENEPGELRFRQGQIDILLDFKEFLTDNLNPKLPRAVRKKLF